MKAEEIYMRQEIRQMLNEVGINKNTLKDLVKEVLNEELKKACAQAMAESNVEKTLQAYFKNNADRTLKETICEEVRSIIREKLFGIRISATITDKDGNTIF